MGPPSTIRKRAPINCATDLPEFTVLSDRKGFDPLHLRERITRRVSVAIALRSATIGANRLILFLTPGCDAPAGGVLSIAVLYRESRIMRDIHGSRVALCPLPGDPYIPKYTWFENKDYLVDLNIVLARCGQLDYLLLQIPEYACGQVADWLDSKSGMRARQATDLHLNVLVQNIDLLLVKDLQRLKKFGRVTCTTNHESYSNAATRERLGVPMHRLSVGIYRQEFFERVNYDRKEPILVVSHDEHPLKDRVLAQLGRALPELNIQVVRGLSYEEYKSLIRRAKWTLTFGEGLDGYFIESVFSGSLAFAVYNERFFTADFAELDTIYPSWDALEEKMAADIERLDEPSIYREAWQRVYKLLDEIYDTDQFRENLRTFYRGEYTFP
jgi:hypothetical protein